MFEVHKLLFSFAMTVKIQEVESELDHEELDFFIKVLGLYVETWFLSKTGMYF